MKNKKLVSIIVISMIVTMILTSCSKDKYPLKDDKVTNVSKNFISKVDKNIKVSNCDEISCAITDKKVISIVIQGMGNEDSLSKLLKELKNNNLKVTFFASGIKVSEESNLAKAIISDGHKIENSTLTSADLTKESYKDKVKEIERSGEAIEKVLKDKCKYLRVGKDNIDKKVKDVAKDCGYKYIINPTIRFTDLSNEDEQYLGKMFLEKRKRGNLVLLDLDSNPDLYKYISYFAEKIKEKSYKAISLDDLIDLYEKRKVEQYKPKKQIDVPCNQYNIIKDYKTDEKKIALTFDDWASDDTVDEILDILDRYNIKSTFFLIGEGVEENPSLAYTISQRGHEIANHTYSHKDVNTISSEELKKEINKGYQVIAKAINKEPSKYLRTPRGIIDEEVGQTIASCGYKDIVLYGIDPKDWEANVSSDEIVDYMINNSKSGGITLLHILDGKHTAEALPRVIENLQNQGYEIVTVGELLN